MKKEKIILLTGGAGFIGANIVHTLIKENYHVHLLLRDSTNLWRIKSHLPHLTLHTTSLLDKKNLTQLITKIKPHSIINLAVFGRSANQTEIQTMLDVNIQAVYNLLEASKNIDYDIFIQTGSSSEYGYKNKAMREMDLLEPTSFYAATKAAGTHLCQVFAKQYNKPIAVVRPFSVYGPFEEKDRFIPTMIRNILTLKPIQLTPGLIRRDFIHVYDVVSLYTQLLSNKKSVSGNIFNIGSGVEYTNDQIVKHLFRIAGYTVPIEKGNFPKRSWDTTHWKADNTNSKKTLNWVPRLTLKQGLTQTFDWFKENNKLYDKN